MKRLGSIKSHDSGSRYRVDFLCWPYHLSVPENFPYWPCEACAVDDRVKSDLQFASSSNRHGNFRVPTVNIMI